MRNPLNNFNWNSLFERYDSLCGSFNANVPYLSGDLSSAETDRKLYDLIIIATQNDINRLNTLSLQTYEAILYWKLYSQPAAVKNICYRLSSDEKKRSKTAECLQKLYNDMPHNAAQDVNKVIAIVKGVNNLNLFGMASNTSLPARTTLLHFIYPRTVPIFDKMVLQAVGLFDKNANQSFSVLEEYIPFAWEMSRTHSEYIDQYPEISPLRLIDMALWVNRGGGNRCKR